MFRHAVYGEPLPATVPEDESWPEPEVRHTVMIFPSQEARSMALALVHSTIEWLEPYISTHVGVCLRVLTEAELRAYRARHSAPPKCS